MTERFKKKKFTTSNKGSDSNHNEMGEYP